MATDKDTRKNPLGAEIAPSREAEAQIGMELMCDQFETGGPVVARVIGKDALWVRVQIEDPKREWIIKPDRIDLAARSWRHVAGDYPARAEKPDFDKEFRPSATATTTAPSARTERVEAAASAGSKIMDAAKALASLLPPDARAAVLRTAETVSGRSSGYIPPGAVYAVWVGRGKLDAPYVPAGETEEVRGAMTGARGYFHVDTVKKYEARGKDPRGPQSPQVYFERL